MDYIRKNGGNGWQFFSPAMNEMVKERLVLGAALKEAISNNQLKLVYQPQIFAETGNCTASKPLRAGARSPAWSCAPFTVYSSRRRDW